MLQIPITRPRNSSATWVCKVVWAITENRLFDVEDNNSKIATIEYNGATEILTRSAPYIAAPPAMRVFVLIRPEALKFPPITAPKTPPIPSIEKSIATEEPEASPKKEPTIMGAKMRWDIPKNAFIKDVAINSRNIGLKVMYFNPLTIS